MLKDSNPFAIYITPSCHFVIRSFFRSVVISYEADEGHPSLKASSVYIRKVLIVGELIERRVTDIEYIANHSLAHPLEHLA